MTSAPRGPARRLGWALAPFQAFFRLEAASSILLLSAGVLALAWANSPWAEFHQALFERPWAVGGLHVTLLQAINEGLMTLFFLLVGMEIKRELAVGELSSVSRAVLPVLAAAGGMIAPAAIYLLLNRGHGSLAGWGIPMATDIAFSIGVLGALRGRVPVSLFAFLTALAIFDDLGGILVIAFVYGDGLHLLPLVIAGALVAGLFACNRLKVVHPLPYLALGLLLWAAFAHAGVHATMAGVAVGLCLPVREHPRRLGPSPLEKWERALHPWVAYGVVPLFALANAAVGLGGLSGSDLLSPVALGVALGLLLGKPVGILLATMGAVRLGISPHPREASRMQTAGVAITGGIGFTVALFIAELAFDGDTALLNQAKLGILIGSAVAAVAGYAWLRLCSPQPQRELGPGDPSADQSL